MNRSNNSSGMTIVEVLVSVIIISLVMGVLFALLLQIQKASTDVKKKSSLLISQNVVTKAIEKDMIEIGVKAISKCTFDQFGFNPDSLDASEVSNCVRIEYNKTYDIADTGYILIYKQKSENSSWVIRYGKGYYQDCTLGKTIDDDDYGSWKDTYSVVQKIDSDVNLVLTDDNSSISVNYTANYEMGKKYSEQKENMGNLFIPISDDNGYNYNLDLSFSFRLNDPAEPTPTNPKTIFSCDSDNLSCNCSGSTTNCDKTKVVTPVYQYVCSESKETETSVVGMNKNFVDLPSVIAAKLYKNRISSITFEDSTGKEDITGIDISYSQNGSVLLSYKQDPSDPTLYVATIYQLGGVSVYGNSVSSMFKGFTNLKTVDFKGFNSTGITNINSMFYECSSLTDLLNFDKFDLSLVKDVSMAFYKCSSLTYSPFKGRTDLGNVRNANSVFNDCKKLVGTDGLFDYNVEFPAYNITTLNGIFKNTGIKKFVMDGAGKSFPNLKNMSSMLAHNSVLLESSLLNLNVPNLVSMNNMYEDSDVLSTSRVENIKSPNLQSMSQFYRWCDKLTAHGFVNIDTHNVSDFSDFLCNCTSLEGDLDLSMLSFDSAILVTRMIAATHVVTVRLAKDGTNFNLDKVANAVWFLGNSNKFEHFVGPTFTMHNCLNANGMFYRTNTSNNYKDLFDVSFLELRNCYNFTQMFMESGYRAIDMSGMHSQVTDNTIDFTQIFFNSSYLTYVFFNDFEFKANINFFGVFDNCSRLTFVDGSFTTQEEIDKYLSGEGDYVLKNGKSPFDNFATEGVITSFAYAFKKCPLLRGFPDGYLDGLNISRYAPLSDAFSGSFSATISKAISISPERYKEIYKLVLPVVGTRFEDSVTSNSDYGLFYGCTNLAVIEIKGGQTYNLASTWDHASTFRDVGKRALEDGRIDKFTFILNNNVYKRNSSATESQNLEYGMKWIFNGFNMNTYANDTGKMEFVLSSNCNTAKTQYNALNGSFIAKIDDKFAQVTYVGPSGCTLS